MVSLYKGKGLDPQIAGSYRGIAVDPALYKLYARILHNRLDIIVEEGGHRSSF